MNGAREVRITPAPAPRFGSGGGAELNFYEGGLYVRTFVLDYWTGDAAAELAARAEFFLLDG